MTKPKKVPPPRVVWLVVDRSDVFSHSAHTKEEAARVEAQLAEASWGTVDRGPFQVVKYVRADAE